MRRFIQAILHIGIRSHMDLETVKRLRIVNVMSVLAGLFAFSSVMYSRMADWPLEATVFLFCLSLNVIVPLVLNRMGKTLASRIYFLLSAYVLILSLPIILGPALHYQYYLLGGIGMPLLFLGDEIGNKKLLLSALAIPLWAYLEWHFSVFDPFIEVSPETLYPLRLLNDLMIFLTVFSIAYMFTTESNRHVTELDKQSEALVSANKELEQFVYSVSHDLKAPIRHIISFASLVRNNAAGTLPSPDLDHLDKVVSAGQRIGSMIEGLLAYSRTKTAVPEKSELNTREVVTGILEEFKVGHPQQVINWDVEDLPGTFMDPDMMQQVWENLISNAIKYSAKKSETNIRIQAHEEEQGVIFSIHDNGAGFDEANAEKLFTIFHRLHKRSEFPGNGIGLASVARMIQLHGGRIWGESKPGQGASFYFSIPKADQHG